MAGFLGINKKISTGVKPVAPVKPAIKPVVAPVKSAIKPVTTGAVKPATIKPIIKPIVKSEEVKQDKIQDQVTETTQTNTEEEVVSLTPVKTQDEVCAVETKEEVVEATVETTVETKEEVVEVKEETTETIEVKETIEAKDDTAKEKVKQKETDIPQGYTEEEWNALSPQKRGAITRKKNQEDKKTKEESETKQESVKSEAYIPEQIPQRTQIPYEEVLSAIIISSAGSDWDMQVAELTQTLKAISIEPDMNTATMKHAMADLVSLKDTIFHEFTLSKTILEATERKIDMVKALNAKGTSSDERKLNSTKACMAHKEGSMTINLFELLDVAAAKHNFYSEFMKQIEFKAKSLITMNGALKLEKDALGQL
jgi:hypothetical protein